MRAEAAVVVNPAAGRGRALRLWPEIAAALARAELTFDASYTAGPGDAARLASEARRAGYRRVVSVGGDGTLNEVVNGLLAAGPPPEADPGGIWLGVVSAGTGCDFVRTAGIPPGPAGVAALASGETRAVDVGRVTFRGRDGALAQRHFVNAADLGLGAEVATRINSGSKRLGGLLSYMAAAVAGIAHSRFRPIEYALDGEPAVADRAAIAFVANGRYAAGGMFIAPPAELDDGLLDVLILREVSKPAFLLDVFPRVYRGKHLEHPRVVHRRAARIAISATDGEPLPLELDGEVPGTGPAEFAVLPRALRLSVPVGRGDRRGAGPGAPQGRVR